MSTIEARDTELGLIEKARRVLPGGTFGNFPGDIVIREGRGGRVWDESGKEYVDFLLGSGPMLVGHAHPEVTAAAQAVVAKGTTFFANNRYGIEDSAGIPRSLRDEILVAPFNDLEVTAGLVREHKDELAGIIVEPFQRIVPPLPGFLEELRRITAEYGVLLIFDEVVTGFRLAYGGAQEYYGVVPDLCTLGKVIGGGFPLAAIAGRADIMAHFDRNAVGDDGFLMQVGTLSGNPVAAAAGLATLEILRRPGAYESLFATGRELMGALTELLKRHGVAALENFVVGRVLQV